MTLRYFLIFLWIISHSNTVCGKTESNGRLVSRNTEELCNRNNAYITSNGITLYQPSPKGLKSIKYYKSTKFIGDDFILIPFVVTSPLWMNCVANRKWFAQVIEGAYSELHLMEEKSLKIFEKAYKKAKKLYPKDRLSITTFAEKIVLANECGWLFRGNSFDYGYKLGFYGKNYVLKRVYKMPMPTPDEFRSRSENSGKPQAKKENNADQDLQKIEFPW